VRRKGSYRPPARPHARDCPGGCAGSAFVYPRQPNPGERLDVIPCAEGKPKPSPLDPPATATVDRKQLAAGERDEP